MFIKRMKCRMKTGHNYKIVSDRPTHFGMGKMFVYRCSCGSEKAKFI